MKTLALGLTLVAAITAPAPAADSPFNGTWKLNTEKSQFTGETFTITAAPGGRLCYSDGSSLNYEFGTDGKDYPAFADRTVSWIRIDDHRWDVRFKLGDKVLVDNHETLSPDGQTIHNTYTVARPDGSTVTGKETFQRLAGGPGPVGKWKIQKAEVAPFSIILSVPAPGMIELRMPDHQRTFRGPTDGTPLLAIGPTIPKGYTLSMHAVGPRKMTFMEKIDGKITILGTDEVSTDGRTLTEVSWAPGKEAEKVVAVYDKQ